MFRSLWMQGLVLGLLMAGLGWALRGELAQYVRRKSEPILELSAPAPVPQPRRYETLKQEAKRWQLRLKRQFEQAAGETEKRQIAAEARAFLNRLLPDMMRCWRGTRWAYDGHCEAPGEGEIACGYFVATVLRDAGFEVNRYRLARQPAQKILETFLPAEALSVRVSMPYESYTEELRSLGSGIRLVGLDTHVGFIVGEGRHLTMVHASESGAGCVVEQSLAKATVLERSRYRVQGNLTAEATVIEKWLRGDPWRVAR